MLARLCWSSTLKSHGKVRVASDPNRPNRDLAEVVAGAFAPVRERTAKYWPALARWTRCCPAAPGGRGSSAGRSWPRSAGVLASAAWLNGAPAPVTRRAPLPWCQGSGGCPPGRAPGLPPGTKGLIDAAPVATSRMPGCTMVGARFPWCGHCRPGGRSWMGRHTPAKPYKSPVSRVLSQHGCGCVTPLGASVSRG